MGCMSNIIEFPKRNKQELDCDAAIDCLFEQMALIQANHQIDWIEMMQICMVGMAKSAVNAGISKERFLDYCRNIEIEEVYDSE